MLLVFRDTLDRGVCRNTNNIYLNNPANVVPIWSRNVFLRGANGIFYRSINERSKQILFYTGTQQAPGAPSALSTVREGKCYISSTGGTGVSITINDADGTPRKSRSPPSRSCSDQGTPQLRALLGRPIRGGRVNLRVGGGPPSSHWTLLATA